MPRQHRNAWRSVLADCPEALMRKHQKSQVCLLFEETCWSAGFVRSHEIFAQFFLGFACVQVRLLSFSEGSLRTITCCANDICFLVGVYHLEQSMLHKLSLSYLWMSCCVGVFTPVLISTGPPMVQSGRVGGKPKNFGIESFSFARPPTPIFGKGWVRESAWLSLERRRESHVCSFFRVSLWLRVSHHVNSLENESVSIKESSCRDCHFNESTPLSSNKKIGAAYA